MRQQINALIAKCDEKTASGASKAFQILSEDPRLDAILMKMSPDDLDWFDDRLKALEAMAQTGAK